MSAEEKRPLVGSATLQAVREVVEALRLLPTSEARVRVLRTVATFYDIDISFSIREERR